MSVIFFDFKKQVRLSKPLEHSPRYVGIEPKSEDIFEQYHYQIKCLEARYGDNQPKKGVVYNQPLKGMIFDTYGRGNVHNSIHQYKPKSKKDWNSPMPFPADMVAIDKFLKSRSGKVLVLGSKSDPFMWMDHKYQITKSVIALANKYDVVLCINTMSDLCANDDYLDLLKAGDHQITMNMGFSDETETESRLNSPGAPSIKRREQAITKLKDAGIEVYIHRVQRKQERSK